MKFLSEKLTIFAVLLLLACAPAHAQFWNKKENKLLPEEQAFAVTAQITGNTLRMHWSIANDYYMYRDKFSVSSSTPGVSFGPLVFPQGVIENDPEFGDVEVYFFNVEISAPVTGLPDTAGKIDLDIKGLGCNKPVGVCYPPQTRIVTVDFDPSVAGDFVDIASTQAPNETKFSSADKTFWNYVLAAFGAGILLSFTPCVLPMIPILLGVIAGQKNLSKLLSGWLAACYVAGTVVIYAIAGWVAGLSGTQLQAHFQNPWVIGVICSLLVALAASLFGVFKIQLPSAIQTRLNATNVNTRSASATSFMLGVISSLVVGACVSPILILTLGAAISKGDPVLGSAIMSAMALGMGSLLILVGFGAGWILPKAGAWMQQVQIVFGFMVLGVAIYIGGFIDQVPVLYLWAALLLWAGYYLYQLSLNIQHQLIHTLVRAVGACVIIWGGMSVIGASTGGNDVLKPLQTLAVGGSNSAALAEKIPLKTVTTLAAAKTLLDEAKAEQKPVMVDFYADWCLDCKRMAKTTFREPDVHTALTGWQLIEVDVTDTNKDSEELKRFFDVFGPPATLFIKPDGLEHADLRQYGYMNKDDFLSLVNEASQNNHVSSN